MEQEKRGNNYPQSVRGLKNTLIASKELNNISCKRVIEDKFLFSNTFSKLSELLKTNNNTIMPNINLNNINESNNNLINNKKMNEKEINNFLVSHKAIFAPYRFYDDAKFSTKSYGTVISYGVNTNQGIVRNYNEDRVSIILNVIKPPSRKNEQWPKVSFFGIFDGHGGTKCSDFLKENLHHYV
jgi:hypothetical protein